MQAVCKAIAIVGLFIACAEAQAEKLDDLDALVGRWTTLRATIAAERRDWDSRREHWQEELELLREESGALDLQLAKVKKVASTNESEQAGFLARKDALRHELADLDGVLFRGEQDLLGWANRLPPSLRRSLDALFKALPASAKAASMLDRAKRVQTIVVLSSKIEDLQHNLHTTREMLEVENGRREVDVIYVGLARAFAVSLNDDWAAVGTPTVTGWSWQPAAEHASRIRAAIDVVERQKTAELIYLPMQLSKGGVK